ncbi:MAG TPA: hypothetical protein VGS97_05030 [Actinocrinis sp.]|uniref:hypothetical protein n=1 Tax=Actinocrinis sp. TaxID=1920516 RepID=UPI002DDD1E76|nr:hypothetical protein [Actinocrinis sp.]HEV2343436.1 hypothetical protein [Actinocrinis sp.]
MDDVDDSSEARYGEQMMHNLAEEVKRALAVPDPLTKAQILAELVQPYAAWATRWAVRDARAGGLSWPSIALALGMDQSVLYRQYEAGGPIVTARAHHAKQGSRNIGRIDGQIRLRQAAAKLPPQFVFAGPSPSNTDELGALPTFALAEPVRAMAHAMAAHQLGTGEAEPLLSSVEAVLAEADRLAAAHGYPDAAASSPWEKAIWEFLGELREAYDRDNALIRLVAAAQQDAA